MEIFVTYLVATAIVIALLLSLASLLLFALLTLYSVFGRSQRLRNFVSRLEARGMDGEAVAGASLLAVLILIIAVVVAGISEQSFPSYWLTTALVAFVLAWIPLAVILVLATIAGLFVLLHGISSFLRRLIVRPREVLGEALRLLVGIPARLLDLILVTMSTALFAVVAAAVVWWVFGGVFVWIGAQDLPASLGMPLYLILLAGLTLLACFGVFTLTVICLAMMRLAVDPLSTGRDQLPLFRVPWNDDAPVEGEASPVAAITRVILASIGFAFGGLPGGRDERPVFRGSRRRAGDAAAQRQRYVQSQLAQFANQPPDSELLEIPPILAERINSLPLTPEAGDARLVTLSFQQEREEFVLFGRVIDALSCLLRTVELNQVREVEVVLRHLRWWELSLNEYPWVVVVRSNRRRELADALLSIREWLGIGVHMAKPGRWRPQMRCSTSGKDGTVAGYVASRASGERFPLTCAHVVGAKCQQALINRQTGRNREPDAALLVPHSCCDPWKDGREVALVSTAEIDTAMKQQLKIRRAGGSARPGIGYVKNRLACYLSGQTSEYFPTFIAESWPMSFVVNLFSWPPFFRRFSEPGDSGAWVLVDDKNAERPAWLGIVVAGGEGRNRRESYVVMAKPLMNYFNRRLRKKGPLTAFLMEE